MSTLSFLQEYHLPIIKQRIDPKTQKSQERGKDRVLNPSTGAILLTQLRGGWVWIFKWIRRIIYSEKNWRNSLHADRMR